MGGKNPLFMERISSGIGSGSVSECMPLKVLATTTTPIDEVQNYQEIRVTKIWMGGKLLYLWKELVVELKLSL